MTTAHRPTFFNALGEDDQVAKRRVPTTKISSRDLPGHRVVKERRVGQGTQDDLKAKDFKAALEEKETSHFRAKRRAELLSEGHQRSDGIPAALPSSKVILELTDIADEPNPFPEDADDEGPKHQQSSRKKGLVSEQGGYDDEDEEESDDEEAELLRELENIKREREEDEAAKREAEEVERAAAEREQVLKSNPLVVMSGINAAKGGLEKSWEDDVVFKNQAKLGAVQKAELTKKRFINDPVRSEFHKKFLRKYIV